MFYKTCCQSYKFKYRDRFRQTGMKAPFHTLDSKQPPTCSTLCNVYELSPRVSEHAPSRGLNPGLPSLHREPKHRPALSTPTSGGYVVSRVPAHGWAMCAVEN